jgi:hypothetical protein
MLPESEDAGGPGAIRTSALRKQNLPSIGIDLEVRGPPVFPTIARISVRLGANLELCHSTPQHPQ